MVLELTEYLFIKKFRSTLPNSFWRNFMFNAVKSLGPWPSTFCTFQDPWFAMRVHVQFCWCSSRETRISRAKFFNLAVYLTVNSNAIMFLYELTCFIPWKKTERSRTIILLHHLASAMYGICKSLRFFAVILDFCVWKT